MRRFVYISRLAVPLFAVEKYRALFMTVGQSAANTNSLFNMANVYTRGPLRIAVTASPGAPSSWRDCNGLLTTEALHVHLDSGRRSSVTTMPDSKGAELFPLFIPLRDFESLEEIPISIATRGRHALCLKCQNANGKYEKHFSFSSESQFSSWQGTLMAAMAEYRSLVIGDFDCFAAPPVHVALPPSPPHNYLSGHTTEGFFETRQLNGTRVSTLDQSQKLPHSSSVKSIIVIQSYVRAAFQRRKNFILNSFPGSNGAQIIHLSHSTSCSSNFASHSQHEHLDSVDDYPTIQPLMNVLLSVDGLTAPNSSRNHPASIAVNLLRLNAKAAAAASVESKFETDTLVTSLKQSIQHLQTSKDELHQEFENFKEVSRQSLSTKQALLTKKDEDIGALTTSLRQISRACGLESGDATKIIEVITNLQEKFMLQSTSTFILQSEIEFTRQNGTRSASLHASAIETKDSEIGNLNHALEAKDSEIENLVACLQAQTEKIADFERANALLREDSIRHQAEADKRLSMYQHNAELQIRALSSERDTINVTNGNLVHDLLSKKLEVDNLFSCSQMQSDNLQQKILEIDHLMSQLHQHADAANEFERSIASISDEAARYQKEAELRMTSYQQNTELKIGALVSARDFLQSAALADAETTKRFRDKYVAALADNSLLLETIKILNVSVGQMQGQIFELESKLSSKDLEISSGKACLQELIRETNTNRELLHSFHSAIDRHSQSIASRSADTYEQVVAFYQQTMHPNVAFTISFERCYLFSKHLFQVNPHGWTDSNSQRTAHESMHGVMGLDDLDVPAQASISGKGSLRRSPNTRSSPVVTVSPTVSTSDFLQRFHIHLSPSSFSTGPSTVRASPEQRQHHSTLSSTADKPLWTVRLPLPLPGDLHFPGENEDLDC